MDVVFGGRCGGHEAVASGKLVVKAAPLFLESEKQ